MKNKLFIYVGLAASLLCSCAQSDVDNGQQQGSTVLRITATAKGGTATRVSVGEDATNGLITKWTPGEALTVYNLYGGSSLTSKSFANNLTADAQTADFDNSGGSHNFTPSSTIYAFNNLASSGNGTYKQTNNSGTFAISLSGYGNQDGTLTNMAQYDALFGTTAVTANGASNSLMMNHLTTAMCFNFINADFTTGTTLTKLVVNCGSTSTSILPANCTATLNADGTLTGITPFGATNWTVSGSSIPAANGAIKVYLMTFPFKTISGPLEFIAQTSANKYYSRAVTMNNLSLEAGTVYPRAANMTYINLPSYGSVVKSKFYMWDAAYPYGGGTGGQVFPAGYGYNPSPAAASTGDPKVNYAVQSCKNCPTARQIYAYLLAGAYIDPGDPIKMDDGSYSYPPSYTGLVNGTTTGATTTYNVYDPFTHALASGSSKSNGVWLPKNLYIKSTLWTKVTGLTSGQGVENYTGGIGTLGTDMKAGTVTTAALATSIRNSGNYFYLPAAGYYYTAPTVTPNGAIQGAGTIGNWWSSSFNANNSCYFLNLDNNKISLGSHYRDHIDLIWAIQ